MANPTSVLAVNREREKTEIENVVLVLFTTVEIYVIITEFYLLYSIDRHSGKGIPFNIVRTGNAYKWVELNSWNALM